VFEVADPRLALEPALVGLAALEGLTEMGCRKLLRLAEFMLILELALAGREGISVCRRMESKEGGSSPNGSILGSAAKDAGLPRDARF